MNLVKIHNWNLHYQYKFINFTFTAHLIEKIYRYSCKQKRKILTIYFLPNNFSISKKVNSFFSSNGAFSIIHQLNIPLSQSLLFHNNFGKRIKFFISIINFPFSYIPYEAMWISGFYPNVVPTHLRKSWLLIYHLIILKRDIINRV